MVKSMVKLTMGISVAPDVGKVATTPIPIFPEEEFDKRIGSSTSP
jgi:hypothetical protein